MSEQSVRLESSPAEARSSAARSSSKKVLVVAEDHLMRDGLLSILRRVSGIRIVGEASEGMEAVEKSLRLRPDVIIMDESMPTMDGIEATRRITWDDPHVGVLLLSRLEGSDLLFAIKAGVRGYLPYTASARDLISAVAAVRAGEYYVHHSVAAVLVEATRQVHANLRSKPKAVTTK